MAQSYVESCEKLKLESINIAPAKSYENRNHNGCGEREMKEITDAMETKLSV
jgi:hypothetical protein